MASKYTWTRSELYNQNGIQIFISRANENNRCKCWYKIENGVETKITHAEAAVYIEPDRAARLEKRKQTRATRRANYIDSYDREMMFGSW